MRLWIRILFILVLSSSRCFCQGEYSYQEQTFPAIEEGISHHQIYAVLQDHLGYLWFGTSAGLDRFDGNSFYHLNDDEENFLHLSHNHVSNVFESSDSILWIGTNGGGLNAFSYQSGLQTYRTDTRDSSTLSSDYITDIVEDKHGNIWIGTRDGLNKWRGKDQSFIRQGLLNQTKPEKISSLAIVENELWVGTYDQGLFKIDLENEKLTQVQLLKEGMAYECINDIHVDEAGKIWIAVGAPLIFQCNRYPVMHHIEIISDGLHIPPENLHAYVLQSGPNNELLIGTQGHGLYMMSKKSHEIERVWWDRNRETTIMNANISDILVDDQERIWLVTQGSGVIRLVQDITPFKRAPLNAYNQQGDLISNFQWLEFTDSTSLWFCTWGEGLHRYNLKTGQVKSYLRSSKRDHQIANDIVWQIESDKSGNHWVCTHDGLVVLDSSGTPFKYYNTENQPLLYQNAIRDVIHDARGNTWIATMEGLNFIRANSDTIIRPQFRGQGHIHDPVVSLYEDSRQWIWMGSFVSGVYCYLPDADTIIRFTDTSDPSIRLSSNEIGSICEDTAGKIWITTLSSGINELVVENHKKFGIRVRNFRAANSQLPVDQIRRATPAANGGILLATSKGLFFRNPITEEFSIVQGPREVPIEYHSAWTSDGHTFYIQMQGALFSFDLDSLIYPFEDHRSVVSSLQIRNEVSITGDWTQNQRVVLGPDENDIRLSFSNLNYHNMANQYYRFKMKPYDGEWREVSASIPFAEYRQVPPGTYHFHLVSGTYKNWGKNRHEMTFVFEPPFYLSTSAYILYSIFLLGLLATIRRLELRRKLARTQAASKAEMSRLRTHLYTSITHEFRTPLSIISGSAEHIFPRIEKKYSKSIQSIQKNASKLLELIDQLLEVSRLHSRFIDPHLKQVDIIKALDHILQSHKVLGYNKELNFESAYYQDSLFMDTDVHLLEYIISNILTNAIKYTPEKRSIFFSVGRSTEDELVIIIEDQGIGIKKKDLPRVFDRFYQVIDKTPQVGFGIGLSLARELTEMLDGRIEISSQFGVGTKVQVNLPIRQDVGLSPYIGKVQEIPFLASNNRYLTEDVATILVVEDDQDLLSFLSNVLEGTFNLMIAEDGMEALEMSEKYVPDLIISDIKMPRMDGYGLCKAIKSSHLTCHIPIILLTGMVGQRARLKGIRTGADLYLTKPFLVEELLAHVHQLTNNSQKLARTLPPDIHHSSSSKPAEKKLIYDPLFEKIEDKIRENLTNYDFKISDLATVLFISPSKLYRKVKGVTGMNPNRYLRVLRLLKAKELLANTKLTIAEIADSCGFAAPDYFSRTFKQEFGYSPSFYRESGDTNDFERHFD
ncbi:MAG: helix-turn-helix domain-containing protein [Saprospiraceae bacterium]|nr:helix-turn-helix domain-containing protein [Saprospiraceae bacterium]